MGPLSRIDDLFQQPPVYSLRRLTEVSEDVFGQPLSEATVVTANQRSFATWLLRAEVKLLLPQAALVHADESGLRVAGKLHWLHVVCTPCLTFYGVQSQARSQGHG